MKSIFSAGLVALNIFSSCTSASPIAKLRADFKEDLEKRANTFAVTGVQDGSGVQPRISLRNMANNADQYNIYLLALTNFKWMDQSVMTSYYQIAGIHGVPNIPWDGVGNGQGGGVGYCTHSSPVFPVWHRVYLALFEQVFLSVVQATVQSFPADQQPRWAAAAKNMRIPYWDWAQGPGKAPAVVPNLLTDKYVTVTGPNGAQQIINPIFRFDHHPLDKNAMMYDPWDFWPVTLRYPGSSTDPGTSSQESMVTSSVQNNAQNLHDSVYNLFTQCSDWTEFANDAAQATTPNCHNSLEGIHDSIHTLLGGGNDGHMTFLWWAAFDPVFWIHHAQVDRLFAMWQVLYPNVFITPSPTYSNTYTVPSGTVLDGNSPLDPFHRDTRGTSWTGNAARSIFTFGYTYPEIQQANGNKATMTSIVNSLYGTSGSSNRKRSVEGRDSGILKQMADKIEGSIDEIIPQLPSNLSTLLTPTGKTQDWFANIATQRFGLNTTYTVYVFMGDYDNTDATTWMTAPNLVGTYGVFSQKGMADMGNNLVVSSSVSLTSALVAKVAAGELGGICEDEATPYLKDNLKWAVAKADYTIVPNDQVPGLQVSVVMSNVEPAQNQDEFPTWTGWNTLSNITHGLAGGLQDGFKWDYWNEDASSDEDCDEE